MINWRICVVPFHQKRTAASRNKDISTPVTPLTKLEVQQAHIQQGRRPNPNLPAFIRSAELAKAFDKRAFSHSLNVLQLMPTPSSCSFPLLHTGATGRSTCWAPTSPLDRLPPQRDLFSPMGLNACIAESHTNILPFDPCGL